MSPEAQHWSPIWYQSFPQLRELALTCQDDGVGIVPGLPPPDTVKPERTTENGVVRPTTGVPPAQHEQKLVSKAGWREVGRIDEDEEELHQDWLSSSSMRPTSRHPAFETSF